MSSITINERLMCQLRSRWHPRGDVLVLYQAKTPPRRFKGKVHYISFCNDGREEIKFITYKLAGILISKVFYTDDGINFEQIKIAPSNS